MLFTINNKISFHEQAFNFNVDGIHGQYTRGSSTIAAGIPEARFIAQAFLGHVRYQLRRYESVVWVRWSLTFCVRPSTLCLSNFGSGTHQNQDCINDPPWKKGTLGTKATTFMTWPTKLIQIRQTRHRMTQNDTETTRNSECECNSCHPMPSEKLRHCRILPHRGAWISTPHSWLPTLRPVVPCRGLLSRLSSLLFDHPKADSKRSYHSYLEKSKQNSNLTERSERE